MNSAYSNGITPDSSIQPLMSPEPKNLPGLLPQLRAVMVSQFGTYSQLSTFQQPHEISKFRQKHFRVSLLLGLMRRRVASQRLLATLRQGF